MDQEKLADNTTEDKNSSAVESRIDDPTAVMPPVESLDSKQETKSLNEVLRNGAENYERVKDRWSSFKKNTIERAGSLFKKVRNTGQQAFEKAAPILFSDVKDLASASKDAVISKAKEVKGSVKSKIENALESSKDYVKGSYYQTIEDFKNAYGAVEDRAYEAYDGVLGKIQNSIESRRDKIAARDKLAEYNRKLNELKQKVEIVKMLESELGIPYRSEILALTK